MDPYLPGQIEMMVLRYLIVNKCEASALKLIDEMHNLRNFLPVKPANFSDAVYLKHLLRLPGTPVLKDVLWDFGNSKILVDEMLYNEEEISASTESLLDKVQMLQEKFKNVDHGLSSATPLHSQQETDESSGLIIVEKVDNFTNTEDYECPECVASRLQVKAKSDSGCQTEEYTAVQFGLQDDIPIVFCETLLNDNTLQQKIAQTINEHMQNPQGEANDISKISSKAVTEIDKFLVDFLKDLPDDTNSMQCDTGLFQNLGVGSVVDIENNLSSMFGESASSVENKSVFPNTPEHSHKIESSASRIVESQQISSGAALIPVPNTSTTPSSSNSCEAAQITPNNNREFGNIHDLISSPSTTSTPNRSQRHQPIKRITPTPLSNAHANPIFNESILVEKKTMEMGNKRAKLSVITRSIETPEWQKLSRRSITPKIPGLAPPAHVPVVKHRDFGDVIRLGADNKDTRQVVNSHYFPSPRLLSNRRGAHTSFSMIEKSPPSANKRKATPVKLSPEKANEKSFILYYPENNKPTNQQSTTKSVSKNVASSVSKANVSSSVKKTHVPFSPVSNLNQNQQGYVSSNKLVLSNENSQQDVTPMQPPPTIETCSTSTLKTISPNALQRLIASANKIGATASSFGNFCNKKKSFSTPRKRKHVRNLSFATPPSLKGVTPGSEPSKGGLGTAQKRKASEDLFSLELRSKKRLNWPDSEKKNKDANNAASIISRRASDSVVSSSTTEVHFENEQACHNHENQQGTSDVPQLASTTKSATVSGVVPKQSLPSIAEESMSNMSVIEEPPQTVVLPSNYQQRLYTATSQVAANSSKQLPASLYAFATTLSDGTTQWQYFQLLDDTQMLVPVDPPPVPEQSVSEVIQEQFPSTNQTPSPTFCATALDKEDISMTSSSLHNVSNLQFPLPPKDQQKLSEQTPPSVLPPDPPMCTDNPVPLQQTSSFVDSHVHSHAASNSGASSKPRISSSSATRTSSSISQKPVNSKNNPKAGSVKDVDSNINWDSTTAQNTSPTESVKTDTMHKSRRRSDRHRETCVVSEPSPSLTKQSETAPRSTRRSSRSKTEDKRVQEKEYKTRDNQNERSTNSSSSNRRSCRSRCEIEPEEINSRNHRGKGKQNDKSKKPKVMLDTKYLFGASPVKRQTSSSKRSPELCAAKAVASQAVPLGSPLKNLPKRPLKESEKTQVPRVVPNAQRNETKDKTVPNISEKAATVVDQTQSPEAQTTQLQQEHVSFNIVPAPLGFPEPTPIKHFTDTSCLNTSDLSCGMNGPLITPFKTLPPPGLNETHFTLPPTPRMVIEDNDSNSNSSHVLKFDPMYSYGVWASTPLKHGVPRTPGRSSSSSNSQSPTQPGKATAVILSAINVEQNQQLEQPQLPTPLQTTGTLLHPESDKVNATNTISSNAARTATTTVDVSSLDSHYKSEGEISSSDDEDNGKSRTNDITIPKQKSLSKIPSTSHQIQRQPPPVVRSALQVSTSSTGASHQQQHNRPLPRHPPLHPLPHISISLNQNLKQTHGINFHVGGREKLLTMSEQETLYSLISMGSIGNGKSDVTRKENPPRPVAIHQPLEPTVAVVPPKPNQTELITHHISLKRKSLDLNRLINIVRKKNS